MSKQSISKQSSRSSASSKCKATIGSTSSRLRSSKKLKLNVHNGKFIMPGPAPNQYKPNMDSVAPRAPAVSFGYKHSLHKLVIFQENDFNYYIDSFKNRGNSNIK